MNAATEAKFKPFESPAARDFSDAKVANPNDKALDAEGAEKASKASFKDILLNSNDETARSRAAQKNGDNLRAAKSDAEFAQMMQDKINQPDLRKPQNELDKDAFLKLFVTQMRNQDPLNPDNSSQMAAQLAQFHGLEQMMNVNKNLEKMQSDEALGRAVGLINFVGKQIGLDNGKLMIEGGKLTTQATVKLEQEVAKATLEVRDASGTVVAVKDMGHLPAGESKLEFSEYGKDGRRLADGAYSFSLMSTDLNGVSQPVPIQSLVNVTGVDLHDKGGSFFTSIGKVGVSEISSVGARDFAKAAQPGENDMPGNKAPEPVDGNPAKVSAAPAPMQNPAQFSRGFDKAPERIAKPNPPKDVAKADGPGRQTTAPDVMPLSRAMAPAGVRPQRENW